MEIFRGDPVTAVSSRHGREDLRFFNGGPFEFSRAIGRNLRPERRLNRKVLRVGTVDERDAKPRIAEDSPYFKETQGA